MLKSFPLALKSSTCIIIYIYIWCQSTLCKTDYYIKVLFCNKTASLLYIGKLILKICLRIEREEKVVMLIPKCFAF